MSQGSEPERTYGSWGELESSQEPYGAAPDRQPGAEPREAGQPAHEAPREASLETSREASREASHEAPGEPRQNRSEQPHPIAHFEPSPGLEGTSGRPAKPYVVWSSAPAESSHDPGSEEGGG